MDPRYDARLESEPPDVTIKIFDGLEGLRRFLSMVGILASVM
jgi:hypothetical protein